MGPVGRTRSDLALAVSLLHEPGTRLEHRLLWYHDGKAPAAGADFDALPDSPTKRHDVALIGLHGSFAEDPAITNIARWSRVIREVEALSGDQEYCAWIEALERDGNFEKRATAAETASAVAGLPAALIRMLADRARTALDSDDFAGCAGWRRWYARVGRNIAARRCIGSSTPLRTSCTLGGAKWTGTSATSSKQDTRRPSHTMPPTALRRWVGRNTTTGRSGRYAPCLKTSPARTTRTV